MTQALRRAAIVAAATAFALSSASGLWVTTIRPIGGQGAMTVYGTDTPWDGYYWPWFGIALVSLGVASAVAIVVQLRAASRLATAERLVYAAAGFAGGGAMAVALYLGPGGSYASDAGLFITRNGPLAYAGLLLAGSPLIVASLVRPARHVLALATALSLVLVTAGLAAMPPHTVRLQTPSGEIPDWRTAPEEPYPFTGPVPPLLATVVDGTYDRPPTDSYVGPPRARCTRCPPFPEDAGRSTLRFDRGRYYLTQQERPYRTFGHFQVTRGHVTFFNDPECGKVRGVYRWRVVGNEIRLTTLFDLCAFGQRARDLTDSVWSPIGPPTAPTPTPTPAG